jgi:hypothetical protein
LKGEAQNVVMRDVDVSSASSSLKNYLPLSASFLPSVKYRFGNRMHEHGALVVRSKVPSFKVTKHSTISESPVKDEHSESVYGSHFAGEPLPERIIPEKEM